MTTNPHEPELQQIMEQLRKAGRDGDVDAMFTITNALDPETFQIIADRSAQELARRAMALADNIAGDLFPAVNRDRRELDDWVDLIGIIRKWPHQSEDEEHVSKHFRSLDLDIRTMSNIFRLAAIGLEMTLWRMQVLGMEKRDETSST